MRYYTAIIILSWIALFVLGISVYENYRLSGKDKILYYLTFILIAVAALAEWLGEHFSGDTSIPTWLLRIIKCADYTLTPMIGGALVARFQSKSIRSWLIQGILLFNVIFQIISCFNGWMIVIDDNNYYKHGSLYILYMCVYLLIMLLIIIEFIVYGHRFRRQNRGSVLALLFLVSFGIIVQEISGGEIRTAYVALTLGVALLYIHNSEFYQIEADEEIRSQELKVLMGQIQPHFLFNCLSVIRETYHEDVQNGDKAINEFANYLRHNMDSLKGKQLVPFKEELKHVEAYLYLQKLRFGDDLDIKYKFEVTDFKLPTLTLQPIVENSITNGIRKQREHTGVVMIRTYEHKNWVEVCVIDNGTGFVPENISEDSERSHIGMVNVKERLRYACGGDLMVESVVGKGTTVKMIIPKGGY